MNQARTTALAALLGALACVAGPSGARAADVDISVPSARLAAFFGHPFAMRAEVLTPPGFDPHGARRYPAIYEIHAFDRNFRPSWKPYAQWRDAIARAPEPFVVVFLDATEPAGHNEFVDSAGDGPWQTALTTELIPALEEAFRLEPDAAGRFVVGHSSGGWSALWLQLAAPDVFGGAWAIAPDPVDFHDFAGPDLADVPPQNFYDGPHGPWPFVRVGGRDTSTLRAYVASQRRLVGDQFASFEAVFSPLGPDGKPRPLFDRRTGDVDPVVAAYWETHYDLTAKVRRDWPTLAAREAGKINVFVGTADTFHLETSVARFARALRELGSDARVTFAPGRDHWSIFDLDGGLIARIVREASETRARELRAAATGRPKPG